MSEIRSQATPERDKSDLADIIHIHVCANNLEDCTGECVRAADALLAAGWLKPRMVETVEEFGALPIEAVVRSFAGTVAARFNETQAVTFGDDRLYLWTRLALPATVLFTPGEAG